MDSRDELNALLTADVQRIIAAAVPERKAELQKLWQQYEPEIRVLDDRAGFVMQAGPYGKIRISPRDGRLLWLVAFSSGKALNGFAGFLLEEIIRRRPIHVDRLQLTPHEDEAFKAYQRLLQHTFDTRDGSSILDAAWPKDVPN